MAIGIAIWKTFNQPYGRIEINFSPKDHTLLMAAVHSYWQDHQDQFSEITQTITPTHLAEIGYLDKQSANRWESISLRIQLPQAIKGGIIPTEIIVEAETPAGEKVALLADGSVQCLSH